MKKQYILLGIIAIFLYLLYLNSWYKWKEYKINSYIEETLKTNELTKVLILEDKDKLEHISTKAYKNKVQKEDLNMKNKGEVVILITNQETFNTYSTPAGSETPPTPQNQIQNSMTIFEKWIFFLFGKDIR